MKERLLQNIVGSEWQYPHLYWFDSLYDKVGKPANLGRGEFETVFKSLQERTTEIIKPFIDCVVKQPSAKLSKRNPLYQGFFCIDVTDDDMSWNQKCHRPSMGGALMEGSICPRMKEWKKHEIMFGEGCKMRSHNIDDFNLAHMCKEGKCHSVCLKVWGQEDTTVQYLGRDFSQSPVMTNAR